MRKKSWVVAVAMGVLLAGSLALGGSAARAATEVPPPCERFTAFAEDYPRLEILDCAGVQSQYGSWTLQGLLSWDGEIAAFEGSAKEGTGFNWPLPRRQDEACEMLLDWIRTHTTGVRGFESHFTGCLVEGLAFLGYDRAPPSLTWRVSGLLNLESGGDPGTAYYEARLGHDLAVREITIEVMEQEPWFAYTAPAPADTGTGLALRALFIPGIVADKFATVRLHRD